MAHRPGPNLVTESAATRVRSPYPHSHTIARATLLPHSVRLAPSSGGGCSFVRCHWGGFLVWGDQRCHDVRVPAQGEGRRRAVHVVALGVMECMDRDRDGQVDPQGEA